MNNYFKILLDATHVGAMFLLVITCQASELTRFHQKSIIACKVSKPAVYMETDSYVVRDGEIAH
jgi:hypothetical protein